MVQVSRLGVVPEEGVKAPVRVESIAPVTLSGPQTVNGVLTTTGMRVLIKDQVDPKENGIYNASDDAWRRASDMDRPEDVQANVLIISQETNILYRISVPPGTYWNPGATDINFVAYVATSLAWGSITGTLSDQTDLQAAIDAIGGGVWEQVAGSPFTPTATNEFAVTWDESLYSSIRIEIENLRTNTNGGTLRFFVGSGGGVKHNSVGDYQNVYNAMTNGTWTLNGTTADIRVAPSWGNAAGQGAYGTVELKGINSSDNGGILEYSVVTRNSSDSKTQRKGHVALEGGIDADIDGFIVGLVAGGHSFLSSGQIRVFGLKK